MNQKDLPRFAPTSTKVALSASLRAVEAGQAGILILIGVLIIAAVAGGAYYFGKVSTKPSVPTASQTPLPSVTSVKEGDETANWKIYTNKSIGFTLKLPPDYKVAEDSGNKVVIGIDQLGSKGFWVLNDKDTSFTNPNSLQTCDVVYQEITKNPGMDRVSCLDSGRKFGQNLDVTSVKLGEADAKSFYITSTGQGGTFHIIQTINQPKIQVYIYSTKEDTINQILSTFKFTK